MPQSERRAAPSIAARAVAIPGKGTSRAKRWSGTLSFVLALSGAAIGFKTVWHFPYDASQNGGGAFILIYVLFAVLIGAPLLIAEVMLGRRAHASPITALGTMSLGKAAHPLWASAGWLAVVGGFLVFSYLCVIAGWTVGYLVRTIAGVFSGLTADGVQSVFKTFVDDGEKQVFWHALFLTGTLVLVSRGLQRIQSIVRAVVPAAFAALLALLLYGAINGNVQDAVFYLFNPDFTKLPLSAVVDALSQVFFSLGIGTGMVLMYGAYLPSETSVVRASLSVVGLNVLATILIGVTVLAIVLGGGLPPTQGPDLLFQTLPLAFDHLPLGRWFAMLFFAFLVCVALLTAIGLIEPAVVGLMERCGWTRQRAVLVLGAAAWPLGIVSILSFNIWAFPLSFDIGSFTLFPDKHLGVFDIVQTVSAQVMLPLAGLLMAVFIGWMLSAERARSDLQIQSPLLFRAWLWSLRLVVPIVLLIVGSLYTFLV